MRVTFLKLLRVAAGYNQREIARILGVDMSLICRYERSNRPMPKALKKKFVAACAKRVDWPPLIRQARR
jgi:transcriptional regulator with XRE-family HTH domain